MEKKKSSVSRRFCFKLMHQKKAERHILSHLRVSKQDLFPLSSALAHSIVPSFIYFIDSASTIPMDNQGILYSLICQADGATVLAEYQRAKGTHGINAKKVLGSVQRANNERKSFSHQRLCYNIQMDAQGTVYMCVTEEGFSRVTAFNFLDAIKKSCGPLKNGGQSPLYAQLKA
jgi:hypothetical protein